MQVHSCLRNQKPMVPIFSEILQWIWIKFIMLPQLLGLLKLMLNLFCTSTIQGRELCGHDFVKYSINILQRRDTCEPICFRRLICFKLGMVLDMTKLCSLIPVWMILMFPQVHRVLGKLDLVQSFCWKFACSDSYVHDGWICEGYDCEEVLYGEYGSFLAFAVLECDLLWKYFHWISVCLSLGMICIFTAQSFSKYHPSKGYWWEFKDNEEKGQSCIFSEFCIILCYWFTIGFISLTHFSAMKLVLKTEERFSAKNVQVEGWEQEKESLERWECETVCVHWDIIKGQWFLLQQIWCGISVILVAVGFVICTNMGFFVK